jgi:hypothetical protein
MNFDLNINNYNRDELINMLELPSNFDNKIVEIKEAKLRDSIINNTEISKETQIKTINFLNEAKKIILSQQNRSHKMENLVEKIYNTDFTLKNTEIENQTINEHMVQSRQEIPYITSYPSEYFSGVINPLKRKTIKRNLNIDSRFRDNYYSSASTNFNLVLPIMFTKVVSMQLSAIELPSTYYVVSKQYSNNFFTVIVNNLPATVNIPDGNYTQITIYQIIQEQLNSFINIDPDFANIVFTCNLSNGQSGTGQTVVGFNGNQNTNSTLQLDFQSDKFGIEDPNTPLPLKLGWLLGFRNGLYINNTNYVSESLLDISGPRYLYLVVDDYNNSVTNNFYSAFNSSLLNKNILARISLQASTFNILEQNNLSIITIARDYFGPVNLQNLNIQLLDEYGRVVDLNYMDFSFCINLTSIYDV